MAFPNTGIAYPADTMATVAWRSIDKNFINLINVGGEHFLKMMADRGRFFVVPDTEQWQQPVMHADPGDTTYAGYKPDNYGAGASLANSSADFLATAQFTMVAASDNVSWGQSHSSGTDLDFHTALAQAKAAVILQREESLFVLGNATADADNPVTVAPYEGDAKFDGTNYKPSNLRGIYCAGTATPGDGGASEIGEEYAGIIGSDSAQWQPQVVETTAANGSALITDIEAAQVAAHFNGMETPDAGLIGSQAWKKLNALLRAESALPQPLTTNLVRSPSEAVNFGGIAYVWHRMLSTADVLNDIAVSGADVTYPFYLLNLKSLRINIPHGGSEIEGLPYIRRIGNTYLVPDKTNMSYRLEWKRQLALDNGRRSFAYINGLTFA